MTKAREFGRYMKPRLWPPDSSGGAAVDEIYLNAGDQISAGSVGVTYGKKLLIGSITARQILVCEQT